MSHFRVSLNKENDMENIVGRKVIYMNPMPIGTKMLARWGDEKCVVGQTYTVKEQDDFYIKLEEDDSLLGYWVDANCFMLV